MKPHGPGGPRHNAVVDSARDPNADHVKKVSKCTERHIRGYAGALFPGCFARPFDHSVLRGRSADCTNSWASLAHHWHAVYQLSRVGTRHTRNSSHGQGIRGSSHPRLAATHIWVGLPAGMG